MLLLQNCGIIIAYGRLRPQPKKKNKTTLKTLWYNTTKESVTTSLKRSHQYKPDAAVSYERW